VLPVTEFHLLETKHRHKQHSGEERGRTKPANCHLNEMDSLQYKDGLWLPLWIFFFEWTVAILLRRREWTVNKGNWPKTIQHNATHRPRGRVPQTTRGQQPKTATSKPTSIHNLQP
jgi:hypothetical protein